MPIPATCPSCSAKYKIVDSAAGRRVKCRTCKQPFYVPGEARNVKAPLSESALAELERNATPVDDSREAMIRYKAVVSTMATHPIKSTSSK